MFVIRKKSTCSAARLTKLNLPHGQVAGPFFMPIATRAAVKTLIAKELLPLGAEIILSNTYHLNLAPGEETLKRAGGLNKFMDWPRPILTDSGGYQVFSLAHKRKITEAGVSFADTVTGQKHLLTPEKTVQIQRTIGADIAMVLDECVAWPAKRDYLVKSVNLTTRWAARGKAEFAKSSRARQSPRPLLFAITQGGLDKKLRWQSTKALIKIGFDGYAIGGLAVGEPSKKRLAVLDYAVAVLPEESPRYLMGVGQPEEIVAAVRRGVDMFDCVLPTRSGRHGLLYIWRPARPQYKGDQFGMRYTTLRIKNSAYRQDFQAVDNECPCPLCANCSRAYLNHLFMTAEPLAARLATLHNLAFYLRLMKKIRWAIGAGYL